MFNKFVSVLGVKKSRFVMSMSSSTLLGRIVLDLDYVNKINTRNKINKI